MDISIKASDAVSEDNSGDEKYKEVLKWAKIAISGLSVTIYAVERGIRYGEIPTELSGVDAALNVGGPVDRFKEKLSLPTKIIKALSYGIMALAYFDKIFTYVETTHNEVVFLGVRLTKGWRRTVLYIVIATAAVPLGIAYYILWHKSVSDATKRWQKPISVITNLGKCFYGIYQLIFYIKNPEIFKDRKLFVMSNIANNITSVVEMWGIDVVLYSADLGISAGAGYIVVYSLRTVIKTTEVVGFALAD